MLTTQKSLKQKNYEKNGIPVIIDKTKNPKKKSRLYETWAVEIMPPWGGK
jgi:hypothetical protein